MPQEPEQETPPEEVPVTQEEIIEELHEEGKLPEVLFERPALEPETETPKVPGKPVALFNFEEYDTPLGVEVMINHVGDCFD